MYEMNFRYSQPKTKKQNVFTTNIQSLAKYFTFNFMEIFIEGSIHMRITDFM